MGYYIQTPDHNNKALQIVNMFDAKVIPQPKSFSEVPLGKALICVIQNQLFDAAGFAFDEKEFEAFRAPDTDRQRPRTWLLMDRNRAEALTHYKSS